jgi:hypothetical protein
MAATTKSKKPETNGESTQFTAPIDMSDMAEINYTAMNAASTIGRRWTETMSALNSELLQFAGRRFREDMVVPAELVKCRSGEEMFDVCSDYFKKAVNHYFEEAEMLAHIGANFVGNATKVVEAETRDVHNIAVD